MKNVMGLIKLTDTEEALRQLIYDRNVAAVPFAGKYRVIDFVLSNMVNSGIKNIGIITHSKYRTLMDHLRSGKEWDLHRKKDGLFILPPDHANHYSCIYKGDLEHLQEHLEYLQRSKQQDVILTGGNLVYNLDYRKVCQFHQEAGADITVLYQEAGINAAEAPRRITLETADDNRVKNMEVNPANPKSNKLSMEVYILAKSLLLDIINTCIARGQYDFLKDGLIKNIDRLRIYGYPFTGYLARITSILNYYQSSLDLLNSKIWQELFFQDGLIYTKAKDEAPTKYLGKAKVNNSLVAGGCIIEGQVENSILFRGVKVGPGARIKESVILPKVTIEAGAVVEQSVLDKEVIITKRKFLKGDVKFPVVVGKQTII